MSRPFIEFTDSFLESNKSYSDYRNILYQKSDSWSSWVVGFAIASFALFAGNIDKFKGLLTPQVISEILLWLVISIISGVFYRFFYVHFSTVEMNTFRKMEVDFRSTGHYPDSHKITIDADFEEILPVLELELDRDLSSFLSLYVQAGENE